MKRAVLASVIAAAFVTGILTATIPYQNAEADRPRGIGVYINTQGGSGYNSDTSEFEIQVLVKLPRGSEPSDYQVTTTLDIFHGGELIDNLHKTLTVEPSNLPAEGGNNSYVHKFPVRVAYEVPRDLDGESVKIKITGELFDSDGNKVSSVAKWANITLKRG